MADYRIITVRDGTILWRLVPAGLSCARGCADCFLIYVAWRDKDTGEMSVLSVCCGHCGQRQRDADDYLVLLPALPEGEALGEHWHPWKTPCLDADTDRCAEAARRGEEPARPTPEALTMYERWLIDDLTSTLVEDD